MYQDDNLIKKNFIYFIIEFLQRKFKDINDNIDETLEE